MLLPSSSLDTILPFSHPEGVSIAQTLCRAEEARRLARLPSLTSHAKTKVRYDRRHAPASYFMGDLVWLWTLLPNLSDKFCDKFLSTYTGPFVVVRKLCDLNNQIAKAMSGDPRSRKTQVVHVARRKPCQPRQIQLTR